MSAPRRPSNTPPGCQWVFDWKAASEDLLHGAFWTRWRKVPPMDLAIAILNRYDDETLMMYWFMEQYVIVEEPW